MLLAAQFPLAGYNIRQSLINTQRLMTLGGLTTNKFCLAAVLEGMGFKADLLPSFSSLKTCLDHAAIHMASHSPAPLSSVGGFRKFQSSGTSSELPS